IRYVPVPPVTLAFVGGEIPPDGANLEPLAGGPISSYKDTFNAPVVARAYLNLSVDQDGNTTVNPDPGGELDLQYPGLRTIRYYGAHANRLGASVENGVILRNSLSDFLSAHGYNTTGGTRVGELVCFQMIPAHPLKTGALNLNDYAFQVAMELGGVIATAPLYVSDATPPPPLTVPSATIPAVADGSSSVSGFALSSSGT